MFRYKTILGDRLASRKESTQATEVAIKLDVLNRMTELGRPESLRWTQWAGQLLGKSCLLHSSFLLSSEGEPAADQAAYHDQ